MRDWLTARVRKADMDTVLQYLEGCVEEEAEHLLESELVMMERLRRSKKLLDECRKDAQEQYVEEISELIESDRPIMSHWTVISYRRKPKAWAVAGAIRERLKRENDQ